MVSKEGKFQEKKLDILEEGFYNIQYKDHAVYGRTTNGIIKSYDYKTGGLLRSYDKTNIFINYMCVLDDTIIGISADTVETYDILTGELIETNSFIKEQLLKASARNQSYYSYMTYNSADQKLYFACLEGVYEFDLNKNTSRLVLNGKNHKFSKATSALISFNATEQGTLFIGFLNEKRKCEMGQYTYVSDGIESKTAATEVKLYSLERNPTLEDIINAFNASQSEVYVAYDFGTSTRDAKTKIDAINTLNVEVLAGKAPDLLLLDDLSAETYMERELLGDISNVLIKDKYYKNIAKPFARDKKIYAVPMHFKLMGIHADKEIVNATESLESLTTAIMKKYEHENEKLVLDKWMTNNYIDVLYRAYAQSLFTKDGMIDAKRLESFYIQLLKLNSITKYDWMVEQTTEDQHKLCDYSYINIESNDMSELLLEIEELEISISGLTGVQDLLKTTTVREDDNTIGFDYFRKNKTPIFVPSNILALMDSSNYKEEALQFIAYCISEEAYNSQTSIENGFPINKASLKKQFESYKGHRADYENQKGEVQKIRLRALTSNEEKEFTQMVPKLIEYSYTDSTLKKIVLEEAENYINGKGALEQCTATAVEKVNLYLKE